MIRVCCAHKERFWALDIKAARTCVSMYLYDVWNTTCVCVCVCVLTDRRQIPRSRFHHIF